MHSPSSPAAEATVSRGSSEQRAGQGPLRRDSNNATQARHICAALARKADRTAACARAARTRARSLMKVAGSEPQRHESQLRIARGSLAASAMARGSVATLTPRCLLKGKAGLTVSPRPQLAGASDTADAGGVHSLLSPMPKG